MSSAFDDDVFFGPKVVTMRKVTAPDAHFSLWAPNGQVHDYVAGSDAGMEPFKTSATAKHYYVVPAPVAKPYDLENLKQGATKEELDASNNMDVAFPSEGAWIKSDQPDGSSMLCVASGRRSAILQNPKTKHWLRLKGCGDLFLGFHFIEADESFGGLARKLLHKTKEDAKKKEGGESGEKKNETGREGDETVKIFCLRGSNFLHMAQRELNMCHDINVAIAEACREIAKCPKFCPSMEPLGTWIYDTEAEKLFQETVAPFVVQKQDSNAASDTHAKKKEWITPCADILRCYAERRLESHLLRGIERIVKILFHKDSVSADTFSILQKVLFEHFPEGRRESEGVVMLPWLSFCCCAEIANPKTPAPEVKEAIANNFIHFDELMVALAKFEESNEVKTGPKFKWPSALEVPVSGFLKDASASYKQHWDTVRSNIFSSSVAVIVKELLMLSRRLGQEAGFFLQAMQKRNISWGTYDDALGTHCNAHSNNLAVLHPEAYQWQAEVYNNENEKEKSDDEKFILAPLDFDMASQEAHTTLPSEKWQEYLNMEPNGLGLCIGRSEMNSGAEDFEVFSVEGDPTVDAKSNMMRMLVVSSLRDACLMGYVEGTHPGSVLAAEFQKVSASARNFLVPMALILTNTVVA